MATQDKLLTFEAQVTCREMKWKSSVTTWALGETEEQARNWLQRQGYRVISIKLVAE